MKTAFVFPGQGSQKVGMLQDLYNAYPIVKQRFEEADEALGYSITKLCFEGPDTELVKTANTQPAILTASVACYEVLKEQGFTPDIVGGHSLGEGGKYHIKKGENPLPEDRTHLCAGWQPELR